MRVAFLPGMAASDGRRATRLRLRHFLFLSMLVGVGCSSPPPPAQSHARAGEPKFPVVIHQPPTLGLLETGVDEITGRRTGVSCATCHGPSPETSLAARASNPHVDIELKHGSIRCDSCHDSQDRTRLRLADGTALAFTDTMQLCAQCHGPQNRDYDHGAHGGMTGYWDLARGPRLRNQCIDCHAAHAPARGQVHPAPPPRDRGRKPVQAQGAQP